MEHHGSRYNEVLWEPVQLSQIIVSMVVIGSFGLEVSVIFTFIYEASYQPSQRFQSGYS